ncbi:sensor histidine kinase [Glycomyces sp. NRRL B-16210]|uniref:sensor histidine kinase n=1 Tax=Glycomyces sp. NRRL B-16210 TaxID=1463821 RepID=UPI00068A30C0|nr:histidine kinase [Glycomyces sp. NRRL B-16210]
MQQWIAPAARWSAAAAVLGLAITDAFTIGPVATAPAATAAVALAAWPNLRNWLPHWGLLLPAVVSLAATADHGANTSNRAAAWWIAETLALLALVALGARAAGTGFATTAVTLAGLAAGLSPLRLGLRMEPPAAPEELAVLVLLWTAAAAAAAMVGRFLRRQRRERERAVNEARRSQRLSLARDLHDYVAHDVTGIVVQAQAAQVVGEPAQALAALARIETAGLHALSSLDRTVLLLREHDALLRHPGEGFADITALARRFEETGGATASVHIDPALADLPVPEAISALAHRIVTEALTNLRRHAPDATEVRIAVTRLPNALAVEVANGPPGPTGAPAARIAGGQGLQQLAVAVTGLGGTFEAGPGDHDGWRVSAVLPL